MEIADADKKISEMEVKFQTKSEAYSVLVQLKNMLLKEKETLEQLSIYFVIVYTINFSCGNITDGIQ